VETALHQLVVQSEKALDQQEATWGVFLNTEGAFNNTCYDTICDALFRHGGDYTIFFWIRATLEGRIVAATLDSLTALRIDLQSPSSIIVIHVSMITIYQLVIR
jgi:hypothetical protein